MATGNLGDARSTIFNVDKTKYGVQRIFTPADGSTTTASGWTPTGHLPPGADFKTIQLEKEIEEFQRGWLYRYTARELVDFDVISSRELDQGTLNIPIHPIFSRNKWEKYGERQRNWPVQTAEKEPRKGGVFEIDNPNIYNAMWPSLTLASAFITKMHTTPFLDALFLGRRFPMDQSSSTIKLPRGLITIWRRDQGVSSVNNFSECERAFSQALKQLHRKLKWGFALGNHMPWDDVPTTGGCWGATHEGFDNNGRGVIWIFLDQRLVDRLLRNDLTSAEKAGAQYFLAIVMCHELIHAIYFIIMDRSLNRHYEPFFEDCPQCELGYEIETSVFGGLILPLFPHPAAPFAYCMSSGYPNYDDIEQRVPNTLVMNKARPFLDEEIMYFIPIQTLEDIRKHTYWDTAIQRYGFSVMQARAIKYGWKFEFKVDWNDVDDKGVPEFKREYADKINCLEGIHQARVDELANVAQVYHGKQLPPSRKESFKVLAEILNSAAKEETFFDHTQDQEDKLWDIRESFAALCSAKDIGDAAEHFTLTMELLTYLDDAIDVHKETFNFLRKSETLRGNQIFRDRRATLFRWNIGTRRLLNDLFTMLDDIPNKTESLSATHSRIATLLCNLEFVRLQIFPPFPTWKMNEEKGTPGIEELKKWPNDFFQDEIAELEFISNLYAAASKFNGGACKELTDDKLQASQGGSTLSFYCRFLCISVQKFNTPAFMGQNWKDRKKQIEEMIPWLEKLQDRAVGIWLETFELWIKWYRLVGSKSPEEEKAEKEEEERRALMMEKRRTRGTMF